MNLADLRTLVRTQTETVSDELPDATIDWYLQQAFERQVSHENKWPFYEKTWELSLPAGATSISLPSDVNQPGIETLRDVSSGHRLTMIDHTQADQWFGGVNPTLSSAVYFSLWASKIHLWPPISFGSARSYQLRGHRRPVSWIDQGPTAEPDCDSRLHRPMVHYAISLAYAQQEDSELENTYMQRWQLDFNRAATAIMEPVHSLPLVMGPRTSTPIGARNGRPAYTIVTPGGS